MNKSKATYSAFDAAAYYITYKDRTEKEVYDKLREKGYSSQDIEESIHKLKMYGYLSDENYTLSYIKSNINKKGVRRISMELAQKGVHRDIISGQLDEITVDEVGTIEDILYKRYRNIDFSDETQKRRAYGYFMRRGFKQDSISKAITNYKKNNEL